MGLVTYDKTGGYSGFLGNVMFQTAATIGIARKNKMQCAFPHKDYFNFFDGPIPLESVSTLNGMQMVDYNELGYHYNDIKLDPSKNYNLKGYYQSKKYWAHCEQKIKELFTFNHRVKNYIDEKYSFALLKPNLVSIHVRRGDYLNHPTCHPVLLIDYYIDAVEKIKSKVTERLTCLVFSDDPQWCRNNFDEDRFKCLFIFCESNKQTEDMYLMSKCHHNIIANSSFSWWGSELNENKDKIVIAPTKNKWYGSSYASLNLNDLYNDNWILI